MSPVSQLATCFADGFALELSAASKYVTSSLSSTSTCTSAGGKPSAAYRARTIDGSSGMDATTFEMNSSDSLSLGMSGSGK